MQQLNENRRKATDKWIYISRVLAVTSWLLFIVALIISYYAAPEDNYALSVHKNIVIRDHWVMPLTNYLYLSLWVSALASFICLQVTKFRSRRKEDSKQFNIVMLLITVIAWIIYIFTHIN